MAGVFPPSNNKGTDKHRIQPSMQDLSQLDFKSVHQISYNKAVSKLNAVYLYMTGWIF